MLLKATFIRFDENVESVYGLSHNATVRLVLFRTEYNSIFNGLILLTRILYVVVLIFPPFTV